MRFRVGAASAALGVPANVLRDLSVPLEELCGAEGRRLSEAVAQAISGGAALALLAHGLARPRATMDHYARQAALLATERSLAEIGRELGFTERQLRRRLEHAVGYGPRTLARVLRLQRFLRVTERGPGASLARLAADAGFADQAHLAHLAHLARDCRRLTGRSPSMLLSAGAAAAGERTSGSFKPAAFESATLST